MTKRGTIKSIGLRAGVALLVLGLPKIGVAGQQDAPGQPAAVSPPAGDEVVVVARRRACGLQIADHLISDKEFRARAKEWAGGRPVRIVVPAGSSYRCEAEILFRLRRYGVNRATFVER